VKCNLKVYWINLLTNKERRDFMLEQLSRLGMKQQLIRAVTPDVPDLYNVTKLQKPCARNTKKDIAVIASHLSAIYNAVYDDSTDAKSTYALIMEVFEKYVSVMAVIRLNKFNLHLNFVFV
jgi:GR25 family glycosyltransferase involved in LPS biosynthesis